MGLAPYGIPTFLKEMTEIFWPTPNGYEIDLDYFTFPTGHIPRYGPKLVRRFGPPLVGGDGEIPEHYQNIAASLQAQLEVVLNHLVRLAMQQSGSERLCLAGGVAMNCAATGKLISEGIVTDLYVPSCASDAGAALGAAYLAERKVTGCFQRKVLSTAFLGPEYTEEEIAASLAHPGIGAEKIANPARRAAQLLSEGKVIGWFQGRMEFGQRALGARSILADPRRAEMKEIINAKVKFREPFRPFAPSVLEERAGEFFLFARKTPFMTEVYPVVEEKKSVIPAVTHIDGTARMQTVSRDTNPLYWELIKSFSELTGVPVILNTSFNLKGQPIVNTPTDALETFLKTNLDAMICGSYLVTRDAVAKQT
jgi:carbamoyltransferase